MAQGFIGEFCPSAGNRSGMQQVWEKKSQGVMLCDASLFCLLSPGQYLAKQLRDNGVQHGLELAFVWNRDARKLEGTVPVELRLAKLTNVLDCQ